MMNLTKEDRIWLQKLAAAVVRAVVGSATAQSPRDVGETYAKEIAKGNLDHGC